MQVGLARAMCESGQWTELNGRVDILQDPASLKQRVPFSLNSDGSLEPWTSLTASERAAVKNYFRQPESDSRRPMLTRAWCRELQVWTRGITSLISTAVTI